MEKLVVKCKYCSKNIRSITPDDVYGYGVGRDHGQVQHPALTLLHRRVCSKYGKFLIVLF